MSTNVNKQKIDQELYNLLMAKIKKDSGYITIGTFFNIVDVSVNYQYEGWFVHYKNAETYINNNIKSYDSGYILIEDSKHHVILGPKND